MPLAGSIRAALVIALLAHASTACAGWREGPPLPEPRWHHASAATQDGYVMVFGGRVLAGPKRRYNYGEGDLACVYYDPRAKQWKHAERPPGFKHPTTRHLRPRKGEAAAGEKVDRTLPGIPGVAGFPYEVPFATVDRLGKGHVFSGTRSQFFDPRSGTWGQPEGPMYHSYAWKRSLSWFDGTTPTWKSRSLGIAATGPDGRMYLVGGVGYRWKMTSSDRQVLAGLDIYDLDSNEWRRGADMKIERQSLAAAFGPNGKLYVFGGCRCNGASGDPNAVAMTEVYDPKSDTWSEAAPMPEPRLLHAAATGADGRIYLIGGTQRWGRGDPSDRVDIYDPATDSWKRGPSLRVARSGHTASTTGDGTIWVVGGYTPGTGIPSFEELLMGRLGDGTDSVELLPTEKRN